MGLLLALWWSSLLFAAGALLWMCGLILARVMRGRTDRARLADREAVMSAYLAIMTGAGDATGRLRPYQRRARLLAETLLELLGLVRGAERDLLIAGLEGLHIDDRFRDRLSQGSRTGRLAAAEALEAFPGEDTRRALQRLYRTARDPELRIAAVRALIEIGAAPSIDTVLRNLEHHDQTESPLHGPILRRLVADAPDAALAAFDRTDFSPAACAVLADALGASGDYRAVALLTPRASVPNPIVRAAAVRALGMLGHPAAKAALLPAFEDREWEVRAEACEAAGRIADGLYAPCLERRLADEEWWVRFRAAEALAALGVAGIERLRAASRSEVDVVQRAASMALAERGLQ
ncbi:MAG: HEAT repeat domain-containing protein [Pseudomonadota bacterium]